MRAIWSNLRLKFSTVNMKQTRSLFTTKFFCHFEYPSVQLSFRTLLSYFLNSKSYATPSRELTPGIYGGIGRDLLTFVANVWPGTGELDRLCTFDRGKIHRERPAGFWTSPPSWKWKKIQEASWLKMRLMKMFGAFARRKSMGKQ